VKPYIFFKNTGDINAPPGLPPKFTADEQPDVDFQRKSFKTTGGLKECLHERDFSVSDATAESDTENHGSCKQTLNQCRPRALLLISDLKVYLHNPTDGGCRTTRHTKNFVVSYDIKKVLHDTKFTTHLSDCVNRPLRAVCTKQ
jgi:hypothetical protein